MPSTYTTSLKLTLPATGELAGTWGTTVNTGITTLVDDAVAGTASITVGGSDYTLTNTDGAANEARKMFITATGTPGAARNVIVPAVSKLYFVFNNTTGGFALTFKTSGGTGIAVAAGARMVLYCDGTNVVNALNAITLASPLPTSSGGTGLSSFTANRVFYASSTSAIGSSANLTFDGSTLATSAFTATGNVSLNGGTFVFNDAGADLDARFEGDTDTTLLFLDASTDRVGIGTNTPAAKLHLGNNLTTTNTIPFQIGYAADFYGYRLINTSNPGSTAAGTFSIQRGTTTAWVDVLTSDNSGNVGIGTATPNAKFDVASSSFFPAIASTRTGTGTWYVGGDNAGSTSSFRITLNTSNFVTVTTGGDVGIGTSSPAGKVDSVSNATAAYVARASTAGANQTADVLTTFNSDASLYALARYNAVQHIWRYAGTTEGMRLDSSGNLGIGTSSPGYKLDVVGIGKATSSFAVGDSSGNLSGTFVNESDVSKSVTFNADPGNVGASSFMRWNVDGTERMRITAAGNVGIGTNAPSHPLDVNGIIRSDSWIGRANAAAPTADCAVFRPADNTLGFSTANTERMRITSSGDVGIGTNSPGAAVHVVAAANTIPCIFDAPTTGYSYITMRTNGSVYGYFGQGNALISSGSATAAAIRSENELLFSAGGSTERMRVTAAGDVGIGTNSPAAKLHVVGSQAIVQATSGSVSIWKDGTPSKAARMAFNTTTGDGLEFGLYNGSSWSAPVVISSSGYVFINTLTTSHGGNPKLVVNGGSGQGIETRSDAAGSWPFLCGNTATSGDNSFIFFGTEAGGTTQRGSIDYNRAGGLVRYNTTSDYRAKDIIGPVTNSGQVIDSLKVYEGKMKGATQSRPMLVAHEAQAVAPYAVSGVKDEVNEDGTPKFQQIDVSSLVPLLLAEIQSLRARVAALEAQ